VHTNTFIIVWSARTQIGKELVRKIPLPIPDSGI